jgi:hypothetical protein
METVARQFQKEEANFCDIIAEEISEHYPIL